MGHAEPVTETPEAPPPPRRRRRAARRAAGPPSVDAGRAAEPAGSDPQTPLPAQAWQDAPHVPGPGHRPGGHGTAGRGLAGDAEDVRPAGRAVGSDGTAPPEKGPAAGDPAAREHRRSGRSSREEAAERSLRSLVTTRSSQVAPVAAMRAREVAIPTADDLAVAESEVTLVRRHYVPPTALTAGRRSERPRRRPPDGC